MFLREDVVLNIRFKCSLVNHCPDEQFGEVEVSGLCRLFSRQMLIKVDVSLTYQRSVLQPDVIF